MTMVQLSNLDARLAYLALQYHFSRPGSELERETGGPATEGLTAIAPELESQLDKAVVVIELSGAQRDRLSSAIAGAINELKSTPLLAAAGRQSMVPAFREALRRLFPDAAEDPDEATQLARHLLTLRGRLEQLPGRAVDEQSRAEQRPRWRFWQRN